MKPTKFGSDKNPFAKVVKKAAGGDATSFGKAFAAARKENPGKNFTYNGKSYTTELKEESASRGKKPISAPAAAPSADANTQAAIARFKAAPYVPNTAAKSYEAQSRRAALMATQSKKAAADKLDALVSAEKNAKKPTAAPAAPATPDAATQAAIARFKAAPYTPNTADRSPATQSRRAAMMAIQSKKAAAEKLAGRAKFDNAAADASEGVPSMLERPMFKKGGESKAMMKKEVAFMKKKGAPKSMVKHEAAEMKMAKGGGIERKGKTNTKMVKMAKGGSIDGIAMRGKTRGCK